MSCPAYGAISYDRARKIRGMMPKGDQTWLPSGGEIHYLWHYIQGSIMSPDVRLNLRGAWGFCERHAWIALLVEASFRHGFMMGPAILYEDLMDSAAQTLGRRGPLKDWRFLNRIRDKCPCLMCDMDLGPGTKGSGRKDLTARGRDTTELCRLAEMSRPYWEKTVCGRCLGNGAWYRCRPHLLEDAANGPVENLSSHRAHIQKMRHHMALYSRSFAWEHRGTATDEDKASLISAVGWCSGWRPFISIVGIKDH